MISELKRALHLMKTCGWSGAENEPFCLDSSGRQCWESEEGVARFSVHGALLTCGAYPEGWYVLESVIAPAHAAEARFVLEQKPTTVERARQWQRLCRVAFSEPTLEEWLMVFDRRSEQVQHAFALAIQRAKKTGERR